MSVHSLTERFCGTVLLVLLATGSGQATAYYPPYGYQPQVGYPQQYPAQYPDNGGAGPYAQPYQYPDNRAGGMYPQPYQFPDNRGGMYPQPYQFPDNRGSGMYPQQQYPGQSNAAQAPGYWDPYAQQVQQQQPRVETSVSDMTPYEQQSLVYRVRIISSGNVQIAAPVLPQSSDLVLRELGEPLTTSSDHGDGREYVTEYSYLLMPLTSGVIEIPRPRVTGRHTGGPGDGPAFDVSGKPLMLNVRAATDAVQPWLPLYSLRISAKLRDSETPMVGNPMEMEVETRAVGATGSQIPSVAGLLESEDFRIYPGKSSSEGSLARDGKTLEGRRVETFTLVPRFGGWLNLPGANINWWNVRYNRPEVAALISDRIHVVGPVNPDDGLAGSGFSLRSVLFWLPMIFALGVLALGWVGLILGDGRLPGVETLKKLFRPVLGELYAPLAAFANRISPRRTFHRMRTWTGRQLPVSWKLWFCLRAVAREDDPAEWAAALQILAAKHLGVRPHAHLRELGAGIVRCHPRANAEAVDRLMMELDEAVYGNTPIRSFTRWKREFRSQIKPGLFPIRFRQCRISARMSPKLPGLNPQ